MKLKLAILAAAAATLISGAAQAQIAPYGYGSGIASAAIVDQLLQPARIVCDPYGRCVRLRPRYAAPVYVPPIAFYPRRHHHRYGGYGRHDRYGRGW
jgi:hypothetical protein